MEYLSSIVEPTGATGGDEVPGVWATNPPLPPDPNNYTHPRGVWGHSAINVDCGSFDITPNVGPQDRKILCCKKLGVEEARFPKIPDDDYVSRLRGLFGADLTYTCAITDTSGASLLYVFIVALDTRPARTAPPFPYFGAAEIHAWVDRDDLHVPPIRWANPDGTGENINVADLTHSVPLTLTQGQPATLNVRVANAGGATMPFMLLLSKLDININP